MSRVLAHRLTRLERQTRARDFPTWHEGHAAAERLRAHTLATLKALLHDQDPPGRDETQARADSAMVDRWCRAHGTYVDPAGARARLEAKLTAMAARYATDPQ